jgi:hypothetical protein
VLLVRATVDPDPDLDDLTGLLSGSLEIVDAEGDHESMFSHEPYARRLAERINNRLLVP